MRYTHCASPISSSFRLSSYHFIAFIINLRVCFPPTHLRLPSVCSTLSRRDPCRTRTAPSLGMTARQVTLETLTSSRPVRPDATWPSLPDTAMKRPLQPRMPAHRCSTPRGPRLRQPWVGQEAHGTQPRVGHWKEPRGTGETKCQKFIGRN